MPKAKRKPRSNAANKDDFDVDELLNDAQQIAAIERQALEQQQRRAAEQNEMREHSGTENARIGMAGFSKATQDPSMFSDAMGLLNDPEAVREAERMMHDPEFKAEISRYMANLKSDPHFAKAMQEAQKKFQDLMKDPAKLEEIQKQYAGVMGGQMPFGMPAPPPAATAPDGGGEGDDATEEARPQEEGEETETVATEAETSATAEPAAVAEAKAEPVQPLVD